MDTLLPSIFSLIKGVLLKPIIRTKDGLFKKEEVSNKYKIY